MSSVPNCAIAHSLTGVGVRSMTVDPTASTGRGGRVEQGRDEVAGRHPDERREHAEAGVAASRVRMAVVRSRRRPRIGRPAG